MCSLFNPALIEITIDGKHMQVGLQFKLNGYLSICCIKHFVGISAAGCISTFFSYIAIWSFKSVEKPLMFVFFRVVELLLEQINYR